MVEPMIFQFIGDSINGAMSTYVNSTVPELIAKITAVGVSMGALYYACIGMLMAVGRVDGVFSKPFPAHAGMNRQH